MTWTEPLRLMATWPLLPVALAQGLRLRGQIPRLPEASGPREHDGLHPSPAGYRAWAEHLAAAVADHSAD